MHSNHKFYQLLAVNILWIWILLIVIFFLYCIHDKKWFLNLNNKMYVISIKNGSVLFPAQKKMESKQNTNLTVAKEINQIAIIITELGFNEKVLDIALRLPPEVMLGFSSYTKDLIANLQKGRSAGHKVFLNIPMHFSDSFKDAGPDAISPDGANYEKAETNISIYANNIDGAYISPGEDFSVNKVLFKSLLEKLKEYNLSVVYSGINKELFKELGVHLLSPDINFIEMSEGDIKNQLLKILQSKSEQKSSKFLLSITASIANLLEIESLMLEPDRDFLIISENDFLS